MNIIEKIMQAAAIPMTTPKAYSTFHILLIVFGLIAVIGLAWLFRRFDEKKNKILLLTFSGILIAAEIFKQFFCLYVINGGEYYWYEIPFQLCSMPIYLCPLAALCKNERIKTACYGFMMTYNLIGGIAAVFEPSGMFHSWVFLTAHSIFWHYSLVFLGFYIIFSRRGGRTMRDYFDTVKLFCVLCFIAFAINTLVGISTDYLIQMFFVGPNPPTIIVFNTIAQKFGWAASTAIYIPIVSFAAGIMFKLAQIGRKKIKE